MKKQNILASIAMGIALAFPSMNTNAESFSINFFPEMPIYRSVMGDSDILKTELNLPGGLEKEILDKPLKELLPYLSLSKEIPIIGLDIKTETVPDFIPLEKRAEVDSDALDKRIYPSDKLLSASLIGSGGLKFPSNKNPEYTARAELFLDSPITDDYLSDGNKLFLAAGINSEGSLNFQEIENKTIYSLSQSFNEKAINFFGGIYIVVKSPYSNQTLIVKSGLDNLWDSRKKGINFNLSALFEFPPITYWEESLRNAKIIPYLSAGIKTLLDSQWDQEFGEIGIKLTGDSGKSIIGYIHSELESGKGISYSSGLKFDL